MDNFLERYFGDIVTWCCHTGDTFVLHTDATYAAASRFGQRIAPGIMAYAFSAGLVIPPAAPAIVANLGADELRFLAPVLIGDTIRASVEVTDKQARKSGGVVDLAWNVLNQNEVQVISSKMKILFAERGHDAA
jgi:3-hydroxybutyryl-CoA dehydratase